MNALFWQKPIVQSSIVPVALLASLQLAHAGARTSGGADGAFPDRGSA